MPTQQPSKKQTKPKKVALVLRVLDREKEALEQAAEMEGMSLSTYIHFMLVKPWYEKRMAAQQNSQPQQ